MSASHVNEPEIWRPVVGWEGVYEVSSVGRVKRVKRGQHTRKGLILKPLLSVWGYERVSLWDKPRRSLAPVHRMVALAFLGQPPTAKHQINHINGIKTDNRPANLEWVTCAGNRLHAIRVLGAPVPEPAHHGEKNGRAKLSELKVAEIRKRYAAGGVSQQRLAGQFGVSQPMIGYIVRRDNWKSPVPKKTRVNSEKTGQ